MVVPTTVCNLRLRLTPPEERRFLPEGLQTLVLDGQVHVAGVCIQVRKSALFFLFSLSLSTDSFSLSFSRLSLSFSLVLSACQCMSYASVSLSVSISSLTLPFHSFLSQCILSPCISPLSVRVPFCLSMRLILPFFSSPSSALSLDMLVLASRVAMLGFGRRLSEVERFQPLLYCDTVFLFFVHFLVSLRTVEILRS